MTRIPMALAGLAVVAVTAAGCGVETSGSASDPVTTGVTPAPSVSETPTAPMESPTQSDDPVPSPAVNKAAKDAIRDDFPALVPAGVPAGWKVTKATYSTKRGGQWWIYLEDGNGAQVTLYQSKKPVSGIVHQYLPGARPAGDVDLSGYGTGTWSSYTGTSAVGLAKGLSNTAAVVVGPDQDTVVMLAQQLLTAEDAASGDGG